MTADLRKQRVVLSNLDSTIKDAIDGKIFLDYKSRLLEIAQTKNKQHKIEFILVGESGPAHLREFEVEVYADDRFLAKAKGHSKKDAEQRGAEAAINVYQEMFGV